MPRKKAPALKTGPYSPDQSIAAFAGCPFTGFGPCAKNKCLFFIAYPPELTERECMIRAIYFTQLVHTLESGFSAARPSGPPSPDKAPVASLIAQSLADALCSLEGLATHPGTSEELRSIVLKTKDGLYARLKTFVGAGAS